MDTSKEILTELQEIAPFLGRSGIFEVPYHVPIGYFNDFAGILMNRIHMEAGGFAGEDAVQEIADISSLLAGLKTKNPYSVPEGYFETLKVNVPGTDKAPAKLIALGSFAQKKRSSFSPIRIVRYAVAACIVALIGLSILDLTYDRRIKDPINELSSVSEQDMANFLDSDDIHWTPGVSPSETSSGEFSDGEIHELFSNVPDDELEQYASAMPEQKQNVN
jgi:hypothetical protein